MVAEGNLPNGEEDNHGVLPALLGIFSTAATAVAALSWSPIAVLVLLVLLTAPSDAGHGYEVLGLAMAVYYIGPVACGLTIIAALLRYWRSRGFGSLVAATAAVAGLVISVFVWPAVVFPG